MVLVGAHGRLVTATTLATTSASGGTLIRAVVSDAATVCAENRPYAIVIPQEVYDFGGSEFDALARDLSAGLVVVPSTVPAAVLGALLIEEASRLG